MKKLLATGFIIFFNLVLIAEEAKDIDSLVSQLEHTKKDMEKVDILNEIAERHLYIDVDRIYDFATEALNISQEINYKKGIAVAYNNLGIYFRVKGIYSESIEFTFKSLDIMQGLKDQQGVARCYNLIGIIYFYLQNYHLSLEYYTKALELNEQQNDKKWIAGNSNNIGMIYERLGEYEKAVRYYVTALEMNTELGNKSWVANNYGNIGSAYLKMNNPQSLDFFKRRLYIKLEQNDKDGIAQSNYLIGNYYYKYKQFDKAINYLTNSLEFANETGSLSILSQSSGLLSHTYAAIGDFTKAYMHHLLYKKYSDSLNIQANMQLISKIETQNKFKETKQLTELKYGQSQFYYLILAIVLLFLVLFIIVLYSRQKSVAKKNKSEQEKLLLKNQKLLDELEFKEKHLKDNIKYLMEKNELLSSVIEDFHDLKKGIDPENQKIINDVILELKSGVEDSTWEEFELRFNQIHNDFYENLKLHFPGLSANEKKLCAFLKLKMSTKEISAITHLSVKSIETARSRLRKKLKIADGNQNLSDFLNKY
ncbi:MAG: tetratricopeptide repeat protein [Bacteroidales bacterium]